MANHPIYADDMQEVVDSFVIEAGEIFEGLDNDLLAIERHPDDRELIDQIFRAVHTVKGTSGFLDLEQLSDLAHHFENVLNLMRKGELAFDPAMIDVMFDAFDLMREMVDQVDRRELAVLEIGETVAALEAIANGSFGDGPAASSAGAKPEHDEEEVAPENHPVFADEMADIVDGFIVEAREISEQLDQQLLQLEKTPEDAELIDEIFRGIHTIKGTSGFLSLEGMSVLAHHFENVLNPLRKGELDFDSAWMDVLFDSFDQLKDWIDRVDSRQLGVVEQDHLLADLDRIAAGEFDGTRTASKRPASDAAPETESPSEASQSQQKSAASRKRRTSRANETIRVEVDRLDNLMDLVGELVLGRNRLLQFAEVAEGSEGDTAEMLRQLKDMSSQVDFITTELQNAVMHTRMVQIGRVFNKFPRVVRDLAKEFGKEIHLEIEGEETELDKSLVEEIGDPLVHLIRNAADHGIEQPDKRLAAGKPAAGRVRLAAEHEGNHIVITISDDGGGIDPDIIKDKAIEKGLISEAEAAEMSASEAYQLIFRPGFSTATQVSQVSGRGVGMDVVKTNITRLNGQVSIESELGKGTTFRLKLPLTLAIIQSLLAKVGEETFAIPLHSVTEVVSLDTITIDTMHGHEVLRHREQVLPLLRVGEQLEADGYVRGDNEYAVIVHVGHHTLGIIVDDLLSQKEIVIKPLGAYLKKVQGIAGSTILGDGRVIMILDLAELVRMQNQSLNGARAAAS